MLSIYGKQSWERLNLIREGSSDVRKAIICFQFSERIKSELIIAARLLGEIGELKGDELAGGKKILVSFLEALIGEINLADSILRQQNIKEAGLKVEEAVKRARSDDHLRAVRSVSEAISCITTSGQHAMEILKQKGLM